MKRKIFNISIVSSFSYIYLSLLPCLSQITDKTKANVLSVIYYTLGFLYLLHLMQ